MKLKGLSGQGEVILFTPGRGAIRHYEIFRLFEARLTMNDKGCRLNQSMQHMH